MSIWYIYGYLYFIFLSWICYFMFSHFVLLLELGVCILPTTILLFSLFVLLYCIIVVACFSPLNFYYAFWHMIPLFFRIAVPFPLCWYFSFSSISGSVIFVSYCIMKLSLQVCSSRYLFIPVSQMITMSLSFI